MNKIDAELLDKIFVHYCHDEKRYINDLHYQAIVPLYWFVGLVETDGPCGLDKFIKNRKNNFDLKKSIKLIGIHQDWIKILNESEVGMDKLKSVSKQICENSDSIIASLLKYIENNKSIIPLVQ